MITVAAAQLPARPLAQAAAALADIAEAVAAARHAGADLVVLPECCYPAYWLGSKDHYYQADILRGQAIEDWFTNLARKHGIAIAAGIVHEHDGVLHDAAIFLDKSGNIVGRHFKTFLWDAEHDWYEPGRQVQPVETEHGQVGLLVCAEGRGPEIFASHAAQDAGLLAMPTAWVNAAPEPGRYYNPQPDFLIPARASEFGLPIVCANKFGQECAEAQFCGMSLIVSGEGEVLSKAPPDQPALLVANVRIGPRRLVLPEVTVRKLLTIQPTLPPADARPLRVAVLAGEEGNLHDGSAALADQQVQMVVRPDATLLHKMSDPRLRRVAHAAIGMITARQATSFVCARLLALEGAQVLSVAGTLNNLPILQVRAVENRVFVIGSTGNRRVVIAPTGAVLAETTDATPLIVELDLAQAAAKLVAPQTHIWNERRPAAYCLSCT